MVKWEIGALAELCLSDAARRCGLDYRPLSRAALCACMSYTWPGGLEEMRTVMERALRHARGWEIESWDLFLREEKSEAGPK